MTKADFQSKSTRTVSRPNLARFCLVCRLPNRPVINTAIVSATVYTEDTPLPPTLDPPITLQYTLLETKERTKPICVFWDHSVTSAGLHVCITRSIGFLSGLNLPCVVVCFSGTGVQVVGPQKAARCSTATAATSAASVTT